MDSEERRQAILEAIHNRTKPIKGSDLATNFGVSRQVIVQDIALLRAGGEEIIATPQGYMILKQPISRQNRKILACKHWDKGMEEELMTIVDFGGTVVDVMVEHEVYGEFKAELMISSPSDVRNFITKMKKEGAPPLASLRQGIHLHTIEAPNIETLEKIETALKEKGYILETH